MTTVVLRLADTPGLYRLGLLDHQTRQVVAIGTDPPQHLDVGDTWQVRDGDEPGMVVVVPFDFDPATPDRFGYTLVPAEALEVSLDRPVVNLDAEMRKLLEPGR